MLNILVVAVKADVNVDLDMFLALAISEGATGILSNITNDATIIARFLLALIGIINAH